MAETTPPGADRSRRARLLGAEPRPEPPRAPRTRRSPAVCDLDRSACRKLARRYPACARTTASTRCSTTTTIDAVAIATPVSTHYELALRGARGRQARLRREAARAARSTRPRSSCSAAADRGLVLMPGHTFLYSPPVTLIRDLIASRRARRDLLHLDEPREPRPSPARRQRRLGSRRRTTSRSCATGWTSMPVSRRRDARGLHHAERPRCRVHQSRVRLGHHRARRALVARAEQASPDDDRRLAEDGRLRRHEQRAGPHLRLGCDLPDPADVRRVPAHLPTGDIVSPHVAVASRSRSSWRTSARDLERHDAALVGAGRARRGPDDRGRRPLAGARRQPASERLASLIARCCA